MTVRTIRLELARCPEFPDGSTVHGYEFRAPLDAAGHFDAAEWKSVHNQCTVRRFWGPAPEEKGKLGNRVSSWIVRLPLEQTDPLARLRAIAEVTQELKRSKQALGIEMIMQVAEWTPPVLLSLGARVAQGPIN